MTEKKKELYTNTLKVEQIVGETISSSKAEEWGVGRGRIVFFMNVQMCVLHTFLQKKCSSLSAQARE